MSWFLSKKNCLISDLKFTLSDVTLFQLDNLSRPERKLYSGLKYFRFFITKLTFFSDLNGFLSQFFGFSISKHFSFRNHFLVILRNVNVFVFDPKQNHEDPLQNVINQSIIFILCLLTQSSNDSYLLIKETLRKGHPKLSFTDSFLRLILTISNSYEIFIDE